MSQSRRSILLAASVALLGITPSFGQQSCKPDLALTEARLSDAEDLRRTWTAVVRADAARCAAPSGDFEVRFIRLKENAPDLAFSQTFTWKQGQTEIALEFWADETVLDYAIGAVASCACRN